MDSQAEKHSGPYCAQAAVSGSLLSSLFSQQSVLSSRLLACCLSYFGRIWSVSQLANDRCRQLSFPLLLRGFNCLHSTITISTITQQPLVLRSVQAIKAQQVVAITTTTTTAITITAQWTT